MKEHVRSLPVAEQLKYFAARECYKKRYEMAPNDEKDADGIRSKVTWDRWFELRYKQKLDDYIAQLKVKG
jgi:hypothetical protein